MAGIVDLLGKGGQRLAESVLGWNRVTIRKGKRELDSGADIVDQFHKRGRKRSEHHLPSLLDDIRDIVNPVTQADPTLRSKRLYSPLTAKEVRRRLHTDKAYKASKLSYHSKYNPIERLWGVLENHWRGELLTSTEKILCLARSMTYRNIFPKTVKRIQKAYKKSVRLTKKQMVHVERRLQRLKGLEKYFILIEPELEMG